MFSTTDFPVFSDDNFSTMACLSSPLRLSLIMGWVILLCLLTTVPAAAQMGGDDYTGTERIGFAFYKISNIEPDFESWITDTEAYQNSMPIERRTMLQNEYNRLRMGFENFNPDYDFIEISTAATINKAPRPIAKTNRAVVNFPYPFNHYFPVKVGDIWVGLVLEQFEAVRHLQLSDPGFRTMNRFIDFNGQGEGKGVVTITVKPVAVDTSQPVDVDGLTVWPMLVKIASMSVWSEGKKQFIWAYDAPWHNSRDRQDLLNLQYR